MFDDCYTDAEPSSNGCSTCETQGDLGADLR
jgi:hypothetical protein